MKKLWKPVNEHYLISNYGEIKSLIKNRILKPNTSVKGYHRYALLWDGQIKWVQVSRLVLLTFIGQPPEGSYQAMHLDDNKNNNRLDNLAWGSSQDNQNLKVLHSRQARGENNGRSKLKKEQVTIIRQLHKDGSYNQSEIARAFNISHGHVWAIINKRNWTQI